MSRKKDMERLIREFSIEKDFYKEETASVRMIRQMVRSLERGEAADSRELWGEEAPELAVFCQYSEGLTAAVLAEKILERIPEESEYQMYQVIVFTDTFSDKLTVQNWKKDIRNGIKNKVKCGLSMISYQILCCWDGGRKNYLISINGRYDCLEMPRKRDAAEGAVAKNITAFTYTADLYDIVKMYNEAGDGLFERNVRYGVKDQLDVEESIKETLREHPEDFWYLNNGITITVQDRRLLNQDKVYSIGLDYSDPAKISVINGAQTISAAAQFWYGSTGNTDGQTENSVLRETAKKAKVLLRIMCVMEEDCDCQKELDKISVALNRQKPIKSEDIAYTNPVIMEINQLYQPDVKDETHFRITKRGENVLGKYKYSLVEFARIVWAYRQEPGQARTQTASLILKNDQGNRQSIYAEEILDQDTEAVFQKYYKPTNFAMCLFTYYGKLSERSTDNRHNIPAILKYGRYYFVAYIISVLQGDLSDFTDFCYSLEKIDDGFSNLVKKYLEILGKISEEYLSESSENTIESNTFKNNKLYEKLIDYEQNGGDAQIIRDIGVLKKEIREWFAEE